MATVNKDFKVKNGLIVEGSNGTINGHDILTKASDDQDYIIGLIGGSATSDANANSVVLRDENGSFSANVITANLVGDITGTVSDLSNHTTDDLDEGSTNLYFTNARAEATISNLDTDNLAEGATNLYFSNTLARNAVSAGEGLNYNNSTGEFSADLGFGLQIEAGEIEVDTAVIATNEYVGNAVSDHSGLTTGVHGVSGDVVGTSDSQTLTNKVLSNAVSLGANLDADNFTVTNLKTPEQASDAATKSYVDAVSEGLHIHASVDVATTESIDFENLPATIDGVTLTEGMRVLVKDQGINASSNGVYTVSALGGLIRAEDYDTAAEIQSGDFVFVSGGTVFGNTGFVQTEQVATLDTDIILWIQFSGAGVFTAGFGLELNGVEFSVDSNVIATISYVSNAIADHSGLTTGVHGVSGDVVGTSDAQTLSNKTLANTVLSTDIDAVNTFTIINLEDPTNNQDAATKAYVDTEISGIANTVVDLDTDDVDEGSTNLYFTNARAEAAMVTPLTTGTQTNISVTYDANTLTYSFVAENGVDDSDTDDLDEGSTNLYFTNARAVAALEAVTPNFVEIDINSVATQVAATTGNIETASQTTAYAWPKANYRSAEFLVKVAYGTHTEVSKVILTMDTSDNIAITEYAIVGTNGTAASVTADISGSDARLRVTTLNNNSTVNIVGTLIV
jgi:hypothetical protein